jgi:hypothetical protein
MRLTQPRVKRTPPIKGPRALGGSSVSILQNSLLIYPLERLNTPSLLALLVPARSAPVEKSNRAEKSVDGAGNGVLVTAPSPDEKLRTADSKNRVKEIG